MHPLTRKITIIGAGNVGATFAYALMLSGLCSEIVLIDQNTAKAEGEVMDLNHAVPLTHPTRIRSGSYADCAGSAITVITAGTAQRPGETRLDLAKRNAAIFKSIIPDVVVNNPDGILLITTNPVDVLSYVSLKLSGLPDERVIGSGTILDTARFRHLLGQHFNLDARSVHAYIIGEHGDSEVPVWSLANIAGIPIEDFCAVSGCSCDDEARNQIFIQTRDAAYHIIERKGATFYAIASGMVRIVESILRDQHTILSVSSHIKGLYDIQDVFISLPCVLNRHGIQRVIRLPLNAMETEALQNSARALQEVLHSLD
ncbi:MAG: L-lactate dehydrogenase [Anaerolineaceae bacterium]|nr:L-lactate dehydrogenase [Anaerolineaceae bacterium]